MKNFRNLTIVSAVGCLLLLSTSFEGVAQKVNFSGTWQINLEKTDLGGAPSYVLSEKVVFNQKSDSIIITRVKDGNPWSETLAFDGTVLKVANPDKERIERNAAVHWEDQTLVQEVHSIYATNEGNVDMKTTYKFRMTDINTLWVEMVFERPDKLYTVNAFYHKD